MKRVAIAVLALCLLASLPASACLSASSEQATTSEQELAQLRKSAASGDSASAMELFSYHISNCRNELEDALFWLRLAAEQESCEGMLEYSRLLTGTGKDVADGKRWLDRALAAGCPAPTGPAG